MKAETTPTLENILICFSPVFQNTQWLTVLVATSMVVYFLQFSEAIIYSVLSLATLGPLNFHTESVEKDLMRSTSITRSKRI